MITHPKPIIVRRFAYPEYLSFTSDWNGGDYYKSQVFNAISMSFPVGEKWIIDTVKRAIECLPAEVKLDWLSYSRDFMSQESTHSAVHKKYNAQLYRLGLFNWWEKKLKKQVEWGEAGTPINQLASSVAYEHLTAAFCAALMGGNTWLKNADPKVAEIWYWHASEELEHKHFVYDLYRALGGSATRRILWFLWAAPKFLLQLHIQVALNLYRTGRLFRFSTLLQAVKYNFSGDGIFWVITRSTIAFLNPNFRPKDSAADTYAENWLKQRDALLREALEKDSLLS